MVLGGCDRHALFFGNKKVNEFETRVHVVQ